MKQILLIKFLVKTNYQLAEEVAKWLAGQTAVLTTRVRTSLLTPDCRYSVQCKVIALLAFHDAIRGPTEFIISLLNWVKMINMPYWHDYPSLMEEKSLNIFLSVIKRIIRQHKIKYINVY